MGCCKCCSPVIINFEYEIGNDIFTPSNSSEQIKLPIDPITDIDKLKEKIICDYQLIITKLERGENPDLEFLLEEISAVDLEKLIDNREFIIQYYLNNRII